jgi:hypothetical protein
LEIKMSISVSARSVTMNISTPIQRAESNKKISTLLLFRFLRGNMHSVSIISLVI